MNKHIDMKSLVIGILLAVSIMLAMGAGHASAPAWSGRFQLVPAQSRLYIIDTNTGEVWNAPAGSLSSDREKIFRDAKVNVDSTAE